MKYQPPLGGDPGDPYVDANPGAGTDGSPVPAKAIEHPQRELDHLITFAGLTPVDTGAGSLEQVREAIQALIAAAIVAQPGDLKWSVRGTCTGYLLCDGSAVNRTTYAALFAVIGTTYGAGDGSTTFNLPDPRQRALVVAGTKVGLTSRTLGDLFGAETHALSVDEMPTHDHQIQGELRAFADAAGAGKFVIHAGVGSAPDNSFVYDNGGGQAHNNLQPSFAANLFIKT